MADQKKQDSHGDSDSQSSSKNRGLNQSGSPGPTPGTAEGDRRTVEEDLRDQGDDRQSP
ncbi:MAG: hypothetical protein V7641_3803 [Blastocatellia bacterium]